LKIGLFSLKSNDGGLTKKLSPPKGGEAHYWAIVIIKAINTEINAIITISNLAMAII